MSKKQDKTLTLKKKTAVKNFRYNRYLMLRYLLAGFFFSNLYWGLALLMTSSIFALLPFGLLLLSVPAIAEHVRLYGFASDEVKNKLQFHKMYQQIQAAINVFLLLSCITGMSFSKLYPFLTNTIETRLATSSVLLAGIILSLIKLKRIQMIYINQDQHYQAIQRFAELNQ